MGWKPAALTPSCPATEQASDSGWASSPSLFTTHFFGTRLGSTLIFDKALSQGALVLTEKWETLKGGNEAD